MLHLLQNAVLDDQPHRVWNDARAELEQRLLGGTCELCESREGVQVHHTRALKDLRRAGQANRPEWVKVMAAPSQDPGRLPSLSRRHPRRMGAAAKRHGDAQSQRVREVRSDPMMGGPNTGRVPSYFPDRVVFLDLGNTMVHLVRYDDEYARGDYRAHHLAIEVDGLEAAMAAVRAAGCRVLKRSSRGRTCGASTSSTRRAIASS